MEAPSPPHTTQDPSKPPQISRLRSLKRPQINTVGPWDTSDADISPLRKFKMYQNEIKASHLENGESTPVRHKDITSSNPLPDNTQKAASPFASNKIRKAKAESQRSKKSSYSTIQTENLNLGQLSNKNHKHTESQHLSEDIHRCNDELLTARYFFSSVKPNHRPLTRLAAASHSSSNEKPNTSKITANNFFESRTIELTSQASKIRARGFNKSTSHRSKPVNLEQALATLTFDMQARSTTLQVMSSPSKSLTKRNFRSRISPASVVYNH